MSKRLYVVKQIRTIPAEGQMVLVRASSRRSAEQHVARELLRAALATPEQLLEAGRLGLRVEEAGHGEAADTD